MKIGQETFVSLSYTLTVDGQVADQATADQPLEFVFGAGFLLPKFEEQIVGLSIGEKFEFTLTPEEGYGETIAEALVDLPKDVFMVDGAVEEGILVVGNQIPMSTQDGQRMLGIVLEVSEATVKMDFNHPMAGKTLNFVGEIVGVRAVTEEDTKPAGGCGSGCGDGGCGDGGCGDDGCGDGGCGCK